MPLKIIMSLLGVPEADRAQIKGWARAWFEHQMTTDDRIFISRDAQRAFRSYVQELLEAQRETGQEGELVHALAGDGVDGRLSGEELAATVFMLLFAGHETASNLIATGVHALLSHRDQWDLLTAHPRLVPRAVEELVRYVTPVQYEFRYTVRDTKLAGTTIPAGATTTAVLACANHDPAVFANPERLDVQRPDAAAHLAFGHGPHFCLGAALARLEGRVALDALVRRLPEMELGAGELTWRGGSQLRGLASVPIRPGALRSAGEEAVAP